MGTPHLRCLLMHQSLRPSVMAVMRFWPTAGTQDTDLMASRASDLCPAAAAAAAAGVHTPRHT
jgi:hypothetical protein